MRSHPMGHGFKSRHLHNREQQLKRAGSPILRRCGWLPRERAHGVHRERQYQVVGGPRRMNLLTAVGDMRLG
jgi:hypothetical protein